MGRPTKTRTLHVWMNDERVGQWTVGQGEHRFAYEDDWLGSAHRRPLSLSMPLRSSGDPYRTAVVAPFFENLLPDSSDLRRRLQNRFGAASDSAFDLLTEIGRDCVGAVQLLPPGDKPPRVHEVKGSPLDDDGVAALLAHIQSPGVATADERDFRISIAGAQEKTALLWHRDRWKIPTGSTPTTHIFKLPIVRSGIDLSQSVENEWLCAQLLPEFGVPCASTRLLRFGGQPVLVVERFDRRRIDPTWIARLPQEDLCQATGTPPAQKYESEGGPGFLKVMDLLLGSSNAAADRDDFFRTQFLFWLLCAIDGHAKNFSVFIEAGGTFRLTPRYDVISAYPVLGKRSTQLSPHKVKLAMAVQGKNRHYRWKDVGISHWLETARRCGVQGRLLLDEVVSRTDSAIAAVRAKLPKGFPTAVSEPIFKGLTQATKDAKSQLARV